MITSTPEPPYYAVVFTSLRTDSDEDGYRVTADRMFELAHRQDGFLGAESARGENGLGITVSYWRHLEAVRAWKLNTEHLNAQQKGKADWYEQYRIRICKVEKEYGFDSRTP